jgi:hypothetical protein
MNDLYVPIWLFIPGIVLFSIPLYCLVMAWPGRRKKPPRQTP